LVLVSLYTNKSFKDLWVHAGQLDLAYLTRETTNRLNDLFLQAADSAFGWSERPNWRRVLQNPQRNGDYVETVAHESHVVNAILVLNRRGDIVATNQQNKEGSPNLFSRAVGKRFPRARRLRRQGIFISRWSDIRIGKQSVHTVWMSFPVLDEDEEDLLGFVVVLLNADKIQETLKPEVVELEKRELGSGIVALVERDTGTVVRQVSLSDYRTAQIKLPADAEAGDVFRQDNRDWFVFTGSTAFGANDFAIVTLVDVKDLLGATERILRLTTIIFPVAVFALAGFLVFFLARALTKPILELSTQAERFGAGDYVTEIRIKSADESGKLALVMEKARRNIAQYVDELQKRKAEVEGMAASFARFVPVEFIHSLGKERVQDIDVGEAVSKETTVFFSDIRRFTAISESMSADDLFNFLNSLFEHLTPPIHAHHGFIDKFIGDAVMALFLGSADDALTAAIEIRKNLELFNQQRQKQSGGTPLQPVDVGIGLNTGKLVMGTVGSKKRLDTTVIGDTVNLASRLEGVTKYFGTPIVISASTYNALKEKEKFNVREIDIVTVIGKTEPVRLYECFDAQPGPVMEQKVGAQRAFAEALAAYRQGEFARSAQIFAECVKRCPQDNIATLYVQRCQHLIARPPSGPWTGITQLTNK